MIKVFDLCDDDSQEGRRLFASALAEIESADFKLKKNYLDINLGDYYSFTVAACGDEFLAFSGLQKKRSPEDFGRMSTRMYIANKFRDTSLRILEQRHAQADREVRFPGSLVLVPHQIHVARSLGLKGVYISREYPQKVNAFTEHMNLHNSFQKDEDKLTALDGIYNVCEGHVDALGCWQRVAILFLDSAWNVEKFEQITPKISLNDWQTRFKK